MSEERELGFPQEDEVHQIHIRCFSICETDVTVLHRRSNVNVTDVGSWFFSSETVKVGWMGVRWFCYCLLPDLHVSEMLHIFCTESLSAEEF